MLNIQYLKYLPFVLFRGYFNSWADGCQKLIREALQCWSGAFTHSQLWEAPIRFYHVHWFDYPVDHFCRIIRFVLLVFRRSVCHINNLPPCSQRMYSRINSPHHVVITDSTGHWRRRRKEPEERGKKRETTFNSISSFIVIRWFLFELAFGLSFFMLFVKRGSSSLSWTLNLHHTPQIIWLICCVFCCAAPINERIVCSGSARVLLVLYCDLEDSGWGSLL